MGGKCTIVIEESDSGVNTAVQMDNAIEFIVIGALRKIIRDIERRIDEADEPLPPSKE